MKILYLKASAMIILHFKASAMIIVHFKASAMIILHFKASAMIGQFDSDGSGSLDRQEFLTLMMNKVNG